MHASGMSGLHTVWNLKREKCWMRKSKEQKKTGGHRLHGYDMQPRTSSMPMFGRFRSRQHGIEMV